MVPSLQRSEYGDRVIGMVLASKRRRHVHLRYLKLLKKWEIELGVVNHSTEDLFWSVTRELGLVHPKTGVSRRKAA